MVKNTYPVNLVINLRLSLVLPMCINGMISALSTAFKGI
jgi:hypothetical protein